MIGHFCAKYTTFDLKKYNGAYFITLKSHAKFEEKLTRGLENDMRNLANFYQNMSKLVFSCDHFVESRKYMSYKLHELRRSYNNDTEER